MNNIYVSIKLTTSNKTNQTSQRKSWTVDLAHKETSQDDLVKLGATSSSQKSVQLEV
jgi:hypothetical protein